MGIKCCYKCVERTEHCHGTCEKYRTERKQLDEDNKNRRKFMQKEWIFASYHSNLHQKLSKDKYTYKGGLQ